MVNILKGEAFIITRKISADNWKSFQQTVPYHFEAFRKLGDLDESLTNLKKGFYYSSLSNETPDIGTTKINH